MKLVHNPVRSNSTLRFFGPEPQLIVLKLGLPGVGFPVPMVTLTIPKASVLVVIVS
jgi:hypothetical protein